VAGRCNASQDAQDASDAGDASLASGRNTDGSDAGSVFADEVSSSNRVINCKSNYLTIWNGITNRGRSNDRCFVLSQGNNKRWGVW